MTIDPALLMSTARRPHTPRRGFTLIETALATIIVGVGVLAMVAAQQAFHKQNHWSTQLGTATRLANEIRELTLNLPRHDPVTGTAIWGPEGNETTYLDYDDLDDFDGSAGNGVIFTADNGSGPLNGRREVIANMNGWSQTVSVRNVNPFNVTEGAADASTTMIEVEVTVKYHHPDEADSDAIEMTRVSWIAPR